MKTSELIGPALDWAVAKCEGKNGVLRDDGITRCIVIASASGVYKGTWKPSVNWSQSGPIIERELIRVIAPTMRGIDWIARIKQGLPSSMHGWFEKTGPTPLIAAMRCYVASKLGEEVEIPNELIGK